MDSKTAKKAPAAKADPAAKKDPAAKGTAKRRKVGLNHDLGNGVYRFSRGTQYHKKGLWKFMGKTTPKKADREGKVKKKKTITKTIGGEKNGGTREVLLKKRTAAYPTANRIRKHPTRKLFSQHKRYIRKSLSPGTVCILLAGRHKGKRVVLMKVLKTGLLLVNGPFKVNACPLRRVHQNYVIATSTKIDISEVKLPIHINDKYFRRVRQKRAKKEEGDIFSKKVEKYAPSEQRKKDQEDVDKQLIAAIKKHDEKNAEKYFGKRVTFAYLKSMFGFRSSQYPHRLKF